jgi:hypothetical protein
MLPFMDFCICPVIKKLNTKTRELFVSQVRLIIGQITRYLVSDGTSSGEYILHNQPALLSEYGLQAPF